MIGRKTVILSFLTILELTVFELSMVSSVSPWTLVVIDQTCINSFTILMDSSGLCLSSAHCHPKCPKNNLNLYSYLSSTCSQVNMNSTLKWCTGVAISHSSSMIQGLYENSISIDEIIV